jgi:hypothetical protein
VIVLHDNKNLTHALLIQEKGRHKHTEAIGAPRQRAGSSGLDDNFDQFQTQRYCFMCGVAESGREPVTRYYLGRQDEKLCILVNTAFAVPALGWSVARFQMPRQLKKSQSVHRWWQRRYPEPDSHSRSKSALPPVHTTTTPSKERTQRLWAR